MNPVKTKTFWMTLALILIALFWIGFFTGETICPLCEACVCNLFEQQTRNGFSTLMLAFLPSTLIALFIGFEVKK